MKIRYIYSACIVIETSAGRILCDPWFSEAFDGAWAQYPFIEDPVATIGPTEFIYVSHVHDDHYDPPFLKQYLLKYPRAKVIIGETHPDLLGRRMISDGIPFEKIKSLQIENVQMSIVKNSGYSEFNLDTALVVTDGPYCVVNMNDNPYDPKQVQEIFKVCDHVDVALLPYAGAGPYPQNYAFSSESELKKAQEHHNKIWADIFVEHKNALKPKFIIPFAGKYYLAGNLADRNIKRGLPDPVNLKKTFPNVFVPEDGGQAVFNVSTGTLNSERTKPYDIEKISALLKEKSVPFRYERELHLSPDRLPLKKLLPIAFQRAKKDMPIDSDFYLLINFESGVCECNLKSGTDEILWHKTERTPRLEIDLDPRYLFGLLTRLYLWQSAEYHYPCRRIPNVYHEKVRLLLHSIFI